MTNSESGEAFAFVVSRRDNVATLLNEVKEGTNVRLVGETDVSATLISRQDIPAAHKIARTSINAGEPVLKYGHRIGHATCQIAEGEWVHLHNCASDVDERSNALDLHTGAPEDTRAAYE